RPRPSLPPPNPPPPLSLISPDRPTSSCRRRSPPAMPPRSPLAPRTTVDLPPIGGVRLAAQACGVRYKDRVDVALMGLAPGRTVAGVSPRSLTASAPVDRCRANLAGGRARVVLVNAGNANAFTGRAGVESVDRCVAAVAERLGCRQREIFVASTGVIGE